MTRQAVTHARPKQSTISASGALRLLVVLVTLTALLSMAHGLAQMGQAPDGPNEQPLLATDIPPAPTAPIPTAIPSTELPPPTPSPTGPLPIGIVAGHWGNDSGAVCEGGLEEVDINLDIAQRVVRALRGMGYQTDLLQEFDPRLEGYRAQALVSIHADACLYPEASGFKVARVVDSAVPDIDDQLVNCLIDRYRARTGLAFHEGSITIDMTEYHTFYEIAPETPGAIIETGFMLADRDILLHHQDLVAQGIVDGILCFVEGEGSGPEGR